MSNVLARMNGAPSAGEFFTEGSEFLESELGEKIRDSIAYHDENGLAPTEGEMHVLLSVLASGELVNMNWDMPGNPSVTDYAAHAIDYLQRRYLTVGK